MKYCSYVFLDKTLNRVIANGEGLYDSRLRPLELTYENTNSDGSTNGWRSISTGKTSSAPNIQFAKMFGHDIEIIVKRFDTKEEGVEDEKRNHENYGITGEKTRHVYFEKRLQQLGWGDSVEDIKESKPFVYAWMNMVLANGDDIKRSYVKKVINKFDGLQEFLNIDISREV